MPTASPAIEYVGVFEVAHILGVSRQRISQLLRENSTFPLPIADLAATPVWDGAHIRSWKKARQSKFAKRAIKRNAG